MGVCVCMCLCAHMVQMDKVTCDLILTTYCHLCRELFFQGAVPGGPGMAYALSYSLSMWKSCFRRTLANITKCILLLCICELQLKNYFIFRGATDGCAPPCGCWDLSLGPLQEQRVLALKPWRHSLSVELHSKF